MSPSPNITLYYLGASRAFRIAWFLEELSLPYTLIATARDPNGQVPAEFKAKIPTHLTKSPVITDGDLVVQESGAITEYLCETYDSAARLLPQAPRARAKVREWIAAAEATFMLHGLAILYTRWRLPPAASDHLPAMEAALSPNVQNDMDWLEAELAGKDYLVGEGVTAADVMMGFSIDSILRLQLGTQGKDWPNARNWLKRLSQGEAYQRAVAKTEQALKID